MIEYLVPFGLPEEILVPRLLNEHIYYYIDDSKQNVRPVYQNHHRLKEEGTSTASNGLVVPKE